MPIGVTGPCGQLLLATSRRNNVLIAVCIPPERSIDGLASLLGGKQVNWVLGSRTRLLSQPRKLHVVSVQ